MPSNPTFPGSVEIKRIITAVIKAGVDIGSIEIEPQKITIHPKEKNAPSISEYDLWKISQGRDSSLVQHTDENSDALPDKTKG
jgi:hypothetical protein